MRIGIDYLQLVEQGCIDGAVKALGSTEEKLLQDFCLSLVDKIKMALSGYTILDITSGNVNSLESNDIQGKCDVEVANNFEQPILEDSVVTNFENSIMTIDEAVFKIKTLGGQLDSIVLKDIANKQRVVDVLGIPEDSVIERQDLDRDFLIRYKNIEGKICEMGEEFIG